MRRTVLVVEDNPITSKMMLLALENRGFDVLAAADAASAERIASERCPDVCLLDLLLPDGNGCDLVPKLRALPGCERMSIVACSGFVSKSEESRISAAGFDDMVTKPVEPSRLLKVVEAHLPDAIPSADRFGSGKTLLVVDDDPIQRKLASVRLARHGFTIDVAADGREALDVARRRPPDAIVSDVLMPRLDGFELCREVRADATLSNIPIVLVTNSYIEPPDRELARGVGAIDLVLRTPELAELMAILRAMGDGRLPRRPHAGSASLQELDERRTRRALRQLDRQVAINAGLTQRCASLAAEISVLRGISGALAENRDVEATLDAVLAACLDAGGVSVGALLLLDDAGSLHVRAHVGDVSALDPERLAGGHGQLFDILGGGRAVPYGPSADGALTPLGMRSALLAPLNHDGVALGALVLAATGDELLQSDRVAFAEAVANQMALAVTLTRTFARQAASERRAREGKDRLRSVLESFPDPVIVVDREGRVTHTNRAVAETLGVVEPGDTVEQLYATGNIYLPDQRTLCPTPELPLVRALRGERLDRAELFWRPEGEKDGLWLSVTALPLRDADGQQQGAVCACRDVTPERRTQAQLMVSDRLASVGMLAAGVAHEINNPLAAVLANVDLALEELVALNQDGDPNRLATAIDELTDALAATNRVREIVKDLRIFARSQEQVEEIVDVRHVLDSTLRIAHNEIRHRARLVRHRADAPVHVLANESRLGQALLNIIINAAQAIAPGRADDNEILVATRQAEHGKVVVSVSDSGSGMTDDVKARLFAPFFTTKPRDEGTGLGLSITHRIITSMGGSIEVDSEPDRGTTFRLILPTSKVEPLKRRPTPAASRTVALRRARVLVVDDEEIIGHVVARALAAEHDVTVETNGPAALARIVAGERFDVILCDMMMPVMTGMDVHAELCRIAPEQAEHMVMLSGGAFTPDAHEFSSRIGNRMLAKPFTPDELRRVVARLAR